MSPNPIPFGRLLGLEIREEANGQSAVHLPSNPDLANQRGEVHGGAIATLLDTAMARASRSSLSAGSMVTTISMTVNFLAPGSGPLTGLGHVTRAGRTVIAAEATVEDSRGVTIARALGTFRTIGPRT